jgi:hypothetical protein
LFSSARYRHWLGAISGDRFRISCPSEPTKHPRMTATRRWGRSPSARAIVTPTSARRTELELQPRETGAWRLDVRADAAGTWLVRAILPESECGTEVQFSVLPDTSTAGGPERVSEPSAIAPLLVAGSLGVALGSMRALARERR